MRKLGKAREVWALLHNDAVLFDDLLQVWRVIYGAVCNCLHTFQTFQLHLPQPMLAVSDMILLI